MAAVAKCSVAHSARVAKSSYFTCHFTKSISVSLVPVALTST